MRQILVQIAYLRADPWSHIGGGWEGRKVIKGQSMRGLRLWTIRAPFQRGPSGRSGKTHLSNVPCGARSLGMASLTGWGL